MKKTVLGGLFVIITVLVGSGCYTPPPPASVAVQASPPAAPVPPPTGYVPPPTGYALPPTADVTYAPDYYVWDGAEYIGVSGANYVYWTGGTWVVAPPVIVERFHGWQRYHPDWHRHAVHYHDGHEHYR